MQYKYFSIAICNIDEAAWNVFDMFSKIRLVLFRSLLESLGRNVAASEDPISSHKSHLLRSNFVDMVEELKSVENEKGFILVASLSASELDSALEFLQREVNNFAGICNAFDSCNLISKYIVCLICCYYQIEMI